MDGWMDGWWPQIAKFRSYFGSLVYDKATCILFSIPFPYLGSLMASLSSSNSDTQTISLVFHGRTIFMPEDALLCIILDITTFKIKIIKQIVVCIYTKPMWLATASLCGMWNMFMIFVDSFMHEIFYAKTFSTT
ncbi:hypothetical protein ACJX0J_029991, partial [Zea mays]